MRTIKLMIGEEVDGKSYVVTHHVPIESINIVPEVLERMSKNLDLFIGYEESIDEFIERYDLIKKGKEAERAKENT